MLSLSLSLLTAFPRLKTLSWAEEEEGIIDDIHTQPVVVPSRCVHVYQILEKEDKGLLGYLLCRLVTLSLVNVVATCLKLGQSGRNAKKMFRKLMPVVQIFMSHRHIPKKRIETHNCMESCVDSRWYTACIQILFCDSGIWIGVSLLHVRDKK